MFVILFLSYNTDIISTVYYNRFKVSHIVVFSLFFFTAYEVLCQCYSIQLVIMNDLYNVPLIFTSDKFYYQITIEIISYYLTFCTFSFEFKESSLSDTRCCITTLW